MNVIDEIKQIAKGRNIKELYKDISLWENWYKGYVQDFHTYNNFNGKDTITRTKKSLYMAKTGCENWSNLLMNEKTTITIPEEPQIVLDAIFKRNNFWSNANAHIEISFALGQGAWVERVKGLETIDGRISKKGKLQIQMVNRNQMYPITYEDGKLIEVGFYTENTNTKYISCHLLNEEGNYDIYTKKWKYNNGNWSLDTTYGENGLQVFHTLSPVAWFQIIKPNITNNKDLNSCEGISIFANAIDNLQAIDNKYDSFDNEFKNGKSRIFMPTSLTTRIIENKQVETFDNRDMEFYAVPEDNTNGTPNKIEHDTPNLRVEEHIKAINSELSQYGYKLGFGKDYFSFSTGDGGGRPIQTATGVIAQHSDLFRNIHKHEILLEEAMIDLVKACVYISNTFTDEPIGIVDEKEIAVNFDDSIFEDTESQKDSARKDIANGTMSEVEYRVKYYGETEEDAEKKLNKSPSYIGKKANMFIALLSAKAITPKQFVKLVFGYEDNEIIKYIEENQSKGFDMESLVSQFGS